MAQRTNHQRTPANAAKSIGARFPRFAQASAQWTGHPAALLLAVAVVVLWVATGPLFGYSDTWQLVINKGTTIVTFLMVFLIQNTQNRETLAVQLKLSKLVLPMKGVKNEFAAIEDLNNEELARLHNECRERAEMMLRHLHSRSSAAQRVKPERRTSRRAARS